MPSKRENLYTPKRFEEEIDKILFIEKDESIDLVRIIAKRLANELCEKNTNKQWIIIGRFNAWLGGLLYLAYIKANVPKTADDIGDLVFAKQNDIINASKRIRHIIGMKYCEKASLMGSGCILRLGIERYIENTCKNMGADDNIKEKALKLGKKVKDISSLSGKSPLSLAAACIYIISKIYFIKAHEQRKKPTNKNILEIFDYVPKKSMKLSQGNISRSMGITEVSLRNSFNSIVGLYGNLETIKKEVIE